MIVHCVYFWLKDGITPEEKAQFQAGVRSLRDIPSVTAAYIGSPADTERRPIIDSSYDCALIVLCKDLAAHDDYQVHEIHDQFRELAHLWQRVQIYDMADEG